MAEKNRHDTLNSPVLVHVITLLELGGAQENTLINCESAIEAGFDVHLISGEGGFLDSRAGSIEGLKFHTVAELVREIDLSKDLSALWKITRYLRGVRKEAGERPVIVHTHSSKAGIIGRVGARLSGCNVIVHTVHGFGINPLQPYLLRRALTILEKVVGKFTDSFVLVSTENGKKGMRMGIFDGEKTVLIRSGFDTRKFISASREDGRRKLGLGDRDFVAGMVACFKPQKGIDDFIRAAGILNEKGYELKYVLVGDGELRPDIMENIISRNLGMNFILSGWIKDIENVIASLDVLVLTSLWEGLPKVIPQAIVAGVPVVATGVDGSVEVVEEGVNGFLVPVNSPEEVAARIIDVREGKVDPGRLSSSGRRLSREFSEGEMTGGHMQMYRRLLEEKGG